LFLIDNVGYRLSNQANVVFGKLFADKGAPTTGTKLNHAVSPYVGAASAAP
jgi:hypothetical protein